MLVAETLSLQNKQGCDESLWGWRRSKMGSTHAQRRLSTTKWGVWRKIVRERWLSAVGEMVQSRVRKRRMERRTVGGVNVAQWPAAGGGHDDLYRAELVQSLSKWRLVGWCHCNIAKQLQNSALVPLESVQVHLSSVKHSLLPKTKMKYFQATHSCCLP